MKTSWPLERKYSEEQMDEIQELMNKIYKIGFKRGYKNAREEIKVQFELHREQLTHCKNEKKRNNETLS